MSQVGVLWLVVSSVILIGCATKPEPHSQDFAKPVPDAYQALAKEARLASADERATLPDVFEDEALASLLEKASQSNFSILAAKAQLKAAGLDIRIAESRLLPDLGLSVNASRARDTRLSATNTIAKQYSNRYGVSLDSQWELDVWGRLSDGVSLSEIAQEEAEWLLNATKQSIAAQVTQTYFDVIHAKRLAKIARAEYDRLLATEKIIENQFALGLSIASDLDNARSARYAALNQLEAEQLAIRQAEQSLEQLLALYPQANLSIGDQYPKVRGEIATGIPSELMLHRPDIQQALLQLLQADTQAQIAYKDLFPSFRLTASFGRASDVLADLTRGRLSVWQLLFGVTQPLFNGGRLQAQLDKNVALSEVAYYRYQQVLIDAFTEVEQLLAAHQTLGEQMQAVEKRLHYAKTVEENALRDYAAGLVSIFDLINAQQAKYSAERTLESLQFAKYQNRVALAVALGKVL